MSGKDHDKVHDLIEAVSTMIKETNPQKGSLVSKLSELEIALDEHLLQEELHVMPLMLKAFTTRELWAHDSFIVNEKLGHCDKDTLIVITKWWFGNISIKEAISEFCTCGKSGSNANRRLEEVARYHSCSKKFCYRRHYVLSPSEICFKFTNFFEFATFSSVILM